MDLHQDFYGTVTLNAYHAAMDGQLYDQFTGMIKFLDGKEATGWDNFRDEHNASWLVKVTSSHGITYLFPGCKIANVASHPAQVVSPRSYKVP